jgi:hypothetical protein
MYPEKFEHPIIEKLTDGSFWAPPKMPSFEPPHF